VRCLAGKPTLAKILFASYQRKSFYADSLKNILTGLFPDIFKIDNAFNYAVLKKIRQIY
jgi:hypothetical protein